MDFQKELEELWKKKDDLFETFSSLAERLFEKDGAFTETEMETDNVFHVHVNYTTKPGFSFSIVFRNFDIPMVEIANIEKLRKHEKEFVKLFQSMGVKEFKVNRSIIAVDNSGIRVRI